METETRYLLLPRLVCLILAGLVVGRAGAGTGLYMGPYFPSQQPRNITVHQDSVAYLPCTVKQLGDKSVSWVRQRDADILTVDRYTFVRDERLTVHYTQDTSTWTLVIKYVQERDAGAYECQISTEPKMSMLVHLNVIVPQVEVMGAADKYVRSGSTARLECKVSSTVQLPDYIFWYHLGDRLLEYDNPRVKMTVSRRGGQGSEMSITSTLIISNAKPSDAGNYTCLPSNLHSATTLLHVLNEEQPAAMHTGSAMTREPPGALGVLLLVAVTLVFVHSHHHGAATTTIQDHHTASTHDQPVATNHGADITLDHHGATTIPHHHGATATTQDYHGATSTHDYHGATTTHDHHGVTTIIEHQGTTTAHGYQVASTHEHRGASQKHHSGRWRVVVWCRGQATHPHSPPTHPTPFVLTNTTLVHTTPHCAHSTHHHRSTLTPSHTH